MNVRAPLCLNPDCASDSAPLSRGRCFYTTEPDGSDAFTFVCDRHGCVRKIKYHVSDNREAMGIICPFCDRALRNHAEWEFRIFKNPVELVMLRLATAEKPTSTYAVDGASGRPICPNCRSVGKCQWSHAPSPSECLDQFDFFCPTTCHHAETRIISGGRAFGAFREWHNHCPFCGRIGGLGHALPQTATTTAT